MSPTALFPSKDSQSDVILGVPFLLKARIDRTVYDLLEYAVGRIICQSQDTDCWNLNQEKGCTRVPRMVSREDEAT